MITNRYQHIYFFVIFIASFFLLYKVIAPFVIAIFVALVCSIVLRGFHIQLEKRFKSKNIAATLAVATVIIVVVVPLLILSVLIFFEARDLYTKLSLNDTPTGIFSSGILKVEESIRTYIPGINVDLQAYIKSALNWIISHTSLIFTSFFKFLIGLVIMIFALFYLFRDGHILRTYFIKLSPLDEEDDSSILKKLELTINSVVRGSLIIGCIQGVLVATGFAIFGIGQPVLWGVVAAFAALIPGVGTALVNLPTILFLVIGGDIFSAIGYGIWSAVVIGSVDNLLAPALLERKVKIHPFLILLSVLGGISFFGPIGFLAGPIILAFATELLKLYPKFTNHERIS